MSLGTSRTAVIGAGLGVLLLILLAVPTISRKHHASDLNHQAATTEQQNNTLQDDIARLNTASDEQQQLTTLRTGLAAVLQSDVSWARMLNEIARTIPNDVWLTSFQGQVAPAAAATGVPSVGPPATGTSSTTTGATSTSTLPSSASTVPPSTTPSAAASINGTVTFSAVGLDFPSVADWLKRISQDASFANLWVPQAAQSQLADRQVVTFTSTADLTDKARSDRGVRFGLGAVQ